MTRAARSVGVAQDGRGGGRHPRQPASRCSALLEGAGHRGSINRRTQRRASRGDRRDAPRLDEAPSGTETGALPEISGRTHSGAPSAWHAQRIAPGTHPRARATRDQNGRQQGSRRPAGRQPEWSAAGRKARGEGQTRARAGSGGRARVRGQRAGRPAGWRQRGRRWAAVGSRRRQLRSRRGLARRIHVGGPDGGKAGRSATIQDIRQAHATKLASMRARPRTFAACCAARTSIRAELDEIVNALRQLQDNQVYQNVEELARLQAFRGQPAETL